MKTLTLTFALISLFFYTSCESEMKAVKVSETEKSIQPIQEKKTAQLPDTFDFSRFKISKGQLGPIKIGMTIDEAEEHIHGLKKEEALATDFGFGGGSPAYIYSTAQKPLFVLIPALGKDSILFIVAIDQNLKTTNGLSPKMTVKDLLKEYPDVMVEQDLMNGWECIDDTLDNWTFVFLTDENNLVGEYPVLEVPSKPKRLFIKIDWITIK